MPDPLIYALHQLLDRERAVLIAANFDALAECIAQKEALLAALENNEPAQEFLPPLRRKINENLALCAAAIKGVAAAKERLDALQAVKSGLSVYDDSGQMAHMPTKHPSLEKKA